MENPREKRSATGRYHSGRLALNQQSVYCLSLTLFCPLTSKAEGTAPPPLRDGWIKPIEPVQTAEVAERAFGNKG